MTEFLTENASRAYPLAAEMPNGTDPAFNRLLLDACICVDKELGTGQAISLMRMYKSETAVIVRVGTSSTDYLDISITPTAEQRITVFAQSASIKAFVVAECAAARTIVAKTAADTGTVSIPFAMRCVSSATKKVTAIETYSAEPCTTPVFTSEESPVDTITERDVVLAAKEGVDIETLEMLPLEGTVMRISAIASPEQTQDSDQVIDLMLRSDDCFTVETLPGTKLDSSGNIVKRTASDTGGVMYGGVIQIGNKCKPCCQCEDYKTAFDSVKNENDKAVAIQSVLDSAKALYATAVTAFLNAKNSATAAVNSYDNVRTAVSGNGSGGIGGNATTATGSRKRLALTVTVTNMTMIRLTVAPSGTVFTVPGYSRVSVSWQTGGSSVTSGTSLPTSWQLMPGDTLVITGIYSQAGNSNEAAVPQGTKAKLVLTLSGKSALTREVTIK